MRWYVCSKNMMNIIIYMCNYTLTLRQGKSTNCVPIWDEINLFMSYKILHLCEKKITIML